MGHEGCLRPRWSFRAHHVRTPRELIEKFEVLATAADALIERFAACRKCSREGRSGWVKQDPTRTRIDAALTAGATIIVSGDPHLLDLGTVEGIEIITARHFLDRLPALSEDTDSTTH